MDLLYVNNTYIGVLNDYIFEGLYIENIQVSQYATTVYAWFFLLQIPVSVSLGRLSL